MADEHRLAARVKRRLLHFLHQRPQSGSAAPGLGHLDQTALVVHMQHRLNGEHGPHHRRGGRNPPSTL